MRSLVLASFVVALTGCGLVLDTSPPDPESGGPSVTPPCERDEECDDGIVCTVDVCLRANDAGGPAGCYHLPQDNRCDQPITSNACAKLVCAPSATWDGSGCAVAPIGGICGDDMRCNLESLTCEHLPLGCDGCDDGDPCNGVESCDATDPNMPICRRVEPGCTASSFECKRTVCDTRSDVPQCVEVRRPAPECLAAEP